MPLETDSPLSHPQSSHCSNSIFFDYANYMCRGRKISFFSLFFLVELSSSVGSRVNYPSHAYMGKNNSCGFFLNVRRSREEGKQEKGNFLPPTTQQLLLTLALLLTSESRVPFVPFPLSRRRNESVPRVIRFRHKKHLRPVTPSAPHHCFLFHPANPLLPAANQST